MNNQNGGLEFDAYINNEKLISSVNEMEKRVKGFSNATVKEAERIDDAFSITSENIKIQKNVIAGLEAQLSGLNAEIDKIAPGQAQYELKKQAALVTSELKAEKEALTMLESEVKKTEKRTVSFRTELRNAREELIKMEQAGLRGSDAYSQMQRKVGELQDAYDDATQQARVLANDERGFQGVISMVSGFTGAMSAAQGAVGLFAGENENLNRIMLKVQSLMAITIGLQQVAETLNKDSYFSIVVLTKAKEYLAIAETKLATAMGVSTAAARVMMATLTLGLSVAITAAVVLLDKYITKQKEAKKAQEEFNNAVVEAAFEPISAINQLASEWEKLGDNIQEKEKFVENNTDKFNDLGVSVNSVLDAENLLIANKQNFIDSLVLKAKAMATTELAAQKYREALEKQLELEKTSKTKTVYAQQGQFGGMITYEVENKKYAELEEEKKKLEEEGAALFAQAAEFTAQEQAILSGIGVSTTNIVEGSIAALEASINKLQEKYKNAAADPERAKLLEEIKGQQELLEKMDKSRSTVNEKTIDDEINEKKNKYDEYYAYLNIAGKEAADLMFSSLIKNGDSFTAYLEGKQRELLLAMSKGSVTPEQVEAIVAISRALDEAKGVSDAYTSFSDELEKIRSESKTTTEYLAKLQELRDKIANGGSGLNPEEKTKAYGVIDTEANSSSKQAYDNLLGEYRDFASQKADIEAEFRDKIQIAEINGNRILAERLRKDFTEQMSSLGVEAITGSDLFTDMLDNLDDLTMKQIDKIIEEIDSMKVSLGVDFTEKDKEELREILENLKSQIAQQNPFSALSKALKDVALEASAENIQKLLNASGNLAGDFGQIADSILAVVDSLGGDVSDTTKDLVSDIVGNFKAAEEGAEAWGGWWGAIIGGLTDLIPKLIKWFGQDRKTDKEIQAHARAVDDLKENYEALEKAVDKALGMDVYKQQSLAIRNLKAQQQEYMAMLDAERSKKNADQDKINEYEGLVSDTGDKIAEMIVSMKEQLLGSDLKSIVKELGDSILDVFAASGDAAAAWGDKVDEIVGRIIKNLLIQKIIEQPVGNIINKYLAKWVDGDGNLLLNADQIMASASQMGSDLKDLGPMIQGILSSLPDDIKKYFTGTGGDDTNPMKGAIQGASEETTSMLSGYANAVRINQIESLQVLRNSLLALDKIAANTSYNVNLSKLDEMLTIMRTMANSDLRSQGI